MAARCSLQRSVGSSRDWVRLGYNAVVYSPWHEMCLLNALPSVVTAVASMRSILSYSLVRVGGVKADPWERDYLWVEGQRFSGPVDETEEDFRVGSTQAVGGRIGTV